MWRMMLSVITTMIVAGAVVVGLAACGDAVTCKGNVVKRTANADGTISLRIHRSAGTAEENFCTAAHLKATTVRGCDVGSNYPQCAK